MATTAVGLGDDARVRSAVAVAALVNDLAYHEVVTSTNDVALAALLDGAPLGGIVVADRQSAGRGRAGRRWRDDVDGPAGPGSLAVTAALPPPPSKVGLAPLAAGLAVAETFGAAGVVATLKWPNDVLLDGRKAAGILVERHELSTHGGTALLVGCGLDVDWRGVDRTGDAHAWTSLAEALGADVDRGWLLARLVTALDRGFVVLGDDPRTTLAAYRRSCSTLGQLVRASLPGGAVVEGLATDVDDDGRLLVVPDRERIARPIAAGDVEHLRPA